MKHAIFIVTILLLIPIAALADDHPTIGQIQASGATADDEFIEILNSTSAAIDIGSWSIQYKSANGSTFYKKNFVKGSLIPGNGTYLIAGSGYTGTYDMKHSSFSLSSAGGTVFLVSNQTLLTSVDLTNIIDQKTYTAAAEIPDSNNQIPNTNTNVNVPTNTNVPITTAPRPPDILPVSINEFVPAPLDGSEWIELYNGTSYAIDLAGWTIADGTGKKISSPEGLISPAGFKLVELNSSRLNDGGDLIILRNADNKEVDTVAYGAWDDGLPTAPIGDDGVAVARIGNGRDTNDDSSDFALTTTATPGAANIITAPTTNDQRLMTDPKTTSSPALKISKTDTQWLADLLSKQGDEIAKLLKADNIIIINNLIIGSDGTKSLETASVATKTAPKTTSKATTTKTASTTTTAKSANTANGMVIVPAGIVGKDICVVREENRSVEVRLPSDLKQAPAAGDIIKTSGTWSTAKTLTLPRLLVKTGTPVTITDHDTPPEPLAISMSKANEHIGEVISTAGTIVEKQPTRLRVADSSDSLLIKTKFDAAKGDRLSAVGLLTKDATDIFLTPLAPDALAIIKPPAAPPRSLAQKALPYGIAALPAGILAGSVYFGKRMKKKKGGDRQ